MDIERLFAEEDRKGLLRVLTCGSVDDGKSTLLGRLLHDSKLVYDDHLMALKRSSERRGTTGGGLDFAFLLDGLKAEREQGITIDVAYRYFATPRRKFIVADTPGHVQYTRNMATGASTADLAVILIDARQGMLPQTRRHSFIASLLGIRHLTVCVNKMDLVEYDEAVFDAIRQEYADFAAKLSVSDIHFIPMSALDGDNVVSPSARMGWFRGAPLLEHLETVHVASDRNLIDLRFPVQLVARPDSGFRGYAGTVASGILRPGDEVLALPSGNRSRVAELVTYDGTVPEAFPPMAVTVRLDDELDISRGDMLVHPNNVPEVTRRCECMVVWMGEAPMRVGEEVLAKFGATTVPATVVGIRYRMDTDTLRRQEAETLALNEIGRVLLQLKRPVACDPYDKNRSTGGLILIDRLTNGTVAAGMVSERKASDLMPTAETDAEPRSRHVQAQSGRLGAAARAERLGHGAATVWLTGLPGAGKSTLAFALEERLFAMGCLVHVLDGENLRLGVSRDLGFTGDDRAENVRRAGCIARICNDAGLITVVALVSPFAEGRREARETVGAERFVEVHLTAAEAVRRARNPAFYGMADSGEIAAASGVTAPYQPPRDPALVLDTGSLAPNACVDAVLAVLVRRGLVAGPAGAAGRDDENGRDGDE